MNKYISLLRGINVSGKNLIKMQDLKVIYENLLFKNVSTYLQSGNVVFCTESNNTNYIARLIKDSIQKNLNLDIPIIVYAEKEFQDYINDNPFKKKKVTSDIYFTFFSEAIETINLEKIEPKITTEEQIIIKNKVAYLYCPNGYGKTKLNNTFLEKNLKVIATTRNFNTTNELLKLLGNIN